MLEEWDDGNFKCLKCAHMPQIRINVIGILVLRHLYFEALWKTSIPLFQYSNNSYL